ncbi:hypothetical protein AMATHDRAFT_88405 [Amanita thiersii Skay4041]|uniref:Uncharacterized protein n=1 Tax=Amanita thiersii Skay4041 TaxID=703135 RepID=A0A2A9NDE9_9AGAR|nr:hypothetical protein AMATHDRAFT_88405 [Amanita thiersii Skay4041]
MDVQPKPTGTATPQVPKGPVKLAVSVEQSRAQRLQRQQARFRDRGGIFNPSSRTNGLVDILMGRRATSPRRSLRRSASCSPTKKRERTPLRTEVLDDSTDRGARSAHVLPDARATSPRKALKSVPPKEPTKKQAGAKKQSKPKTRKKATVSAGSQLAEGNAASKGRGKLPKKLANAESGQVQTDSSKNNAQGSSSRPTPRKRQSKPKKATISSENRTLPTQTNTGAHNEMRPSMPTIVEEEGAGDENPETAKSVKARKKGKKLTKSVSAGTSQRTHAVNAGVDKDMAPFLEKAVQNKKAPLTKLTHVSEKSSMSSGPSRSYEHPEHEGDSAHKQVGSAPDRLPAGDVEREQGVPATKQSSTSTAETTTLSKKRRLVVPESSDEDADNGDPPAGLKRAKPPKPHLEGSGSLMKDSQKQDGLGTSNQPISTCKEIPSGVAQTGKVVQAVKQDSQTKGVAFNPEAQVDESTGAANESKKRARHLDDLSAESVARKRVKNDYIARDSASNDNSIRVPDSKDFSSKVKKGHPKPNKKENAILLKKPPKQAAKSGKSKKTSKLNRGLPKTVLLRLKNSTPHIIDDEPDPIDFLS